MFHQLGLARWLVAGALACAASMACAQNAALLLFGGSGHKTFLGCLNCGEFDQASVCNQFGKGNPFDSDSIWNQFGTFGSQFNSESPWNQFTQDAPVIVDKEGNFYGYLSANEFHPKRTQIEALNTLTKLGAKDISKAQKAFCSRR